MLGLHSWIIDKKWPLGPLHRGFITTDLGIGQDSWVRPGPPRVGLWGWVRGSAPSLLWHIPTWLLHLTPPPSSVSQGAGWELLVRSSTWTFVGDREVHLVRQNSPTITTKDKWHPVLPASRGHWRKGLKSVLQCGAANLKNQTQKNMCYMTLPTQYEDMQSLTCQPYSLWPNGGNNPTVCQWINR